MLKNALKESMFLRALVKCRKKYSYAALWMKHIYRKGIFYRAGKELSGNIDAVLDKEKNILAVNNSMLIDSGIKTWFRAKKHIYKYASTSKVMMMAKTVRNVIYFNTLRNLGLIILTATFTNIAGSLLLAKKSSSLAWFMRANLIIIGVIWISCKVELNELKRTSLWFRMIKKR